VAIRWSAWILGVALLAGGADAFAAEFRILHSESIALAGEDLGKSSGARTGLAAGVLSFEAYGRRFDLELEPNARLLRRLPAAQRAALQQFPMYRGRLAGLSGSWVRLTRVGSELHGMLWDGSELYIIEPAQAAAAFMLAPAAGTRSANVIYRLSDTLSDLGPNFCTVLQTGERPKALASYNALVAELRQGTALVAVPTGEMQVAIIGDSSFVADNSSNPQGVVAARMNNVDGIFSDQVGVQLTVSSVTLFDAASDPFSPTTEAGVLIDEVGDYKNDGANGIRGTGVAHLMTGRNLDGSTVGIAFLESICNPLFGVSLSMGGSEISSSSATLVAAHEIGHNFGAPHDAETGTACESTPNTFLMAAQLNGSDQFSPCSLAQMEPVIDAAPASCIAPLAFSDVALSSAPATVAAPVDQNFSFTVTASSTGSLTVDGVMVTINLPAAITLQSATPSAGSCSSGAGAVTCDLGSIPGGSSRNINVTARGTQAGTFTSTDSVTATNDTNAGNNAADMIVTINPPSNGGGGGGGGALGALVLLSLLLAGTRRAIAMARIQRARLISNSSIGTGRPSA